MSISSIARFKGIAWNTVARWLEKAAQMGRRFDRKTMTGFAVTEPQVDEIRTFAGGKAKPTWIFGSCARSPHRRAFSHFNNQISRTLAWSRFLASFRLRAKARYWRRMRKTVSLLVPAT